MPTVASSEPIFICGSGRSGTTLLFNLMRLHPDVAWVSRLTDHVPAIPQLSFASRLAVLQRARLFQPSPDAISMYRNCGITAEMLREKGASLTEEDVTPAMARRLRRVADAHVRWMGKRRFVNKSTMNTMRVRMINEIFPNAKFIHIIRNGYAVASSLVRVRWWPDADIWWMGTTPRRWQADGGDPYELAAMNWKRQVEEMLANQPFISPDRFLECRYEHLLADTPKTIEHIADFCGLEWSNRYASALDATRVLSGNRDKWKDQLDDDAKEIITKKAGDLIERLGYERAV